jgi:hypothetical protein
MDSHATTPVTGKTTILPRRAFTSPRQHRLLTIIFLAALCLGWSARHYIPILVDRVSPPPPAPYLFCKNHCGDEINSLLFTDTHPIIAGAGKPKILQAETNGLGYEVLLTFASATQIEYQFHYGVVEGFQWRPLMLPLSRVFSLDEPLPPIIRMSYSPRVNGGDFWWEIGILTDPRLIAKSQEVVIKYHISGHGSYEYDTTVRMNSGVFMQSLTDANLFPSVTSIEIYDSPQTRLWRCSGEECLTGT